MNIKNLLVAFLVVYLSQPVYSQVKLPRLVRDSMILQRDTRLKIWGWASAGEKINVKFNRKTYKATTDPAGKWSVTLPAMKAGGPFTMDISGKNKITLKEILVGDVWFCSGQSNMVHQIGIHRERYESDIANANYPMIRHFFIPTMTDLQHPREDLPTGYWKSAVPQNILEFSAVAYSFATTIYEKYKIPIGLINASVGGTPIEAWISGEGLKGLPDYYNTVQKLKDTAYVNAANRSTSGSGGRGPARQNDKGMAFYICAGILGRPGSPGFERGGLVSQGNYCTGLNDRNASKSFTGQNCRR
jgi:sialate O-acetylesterase